MNSITIRINDRELKARRSQTIMEAADEAGITIPRLCNHPSLKPSGSCRLCAVEIEGYRGLPAACTTPVEEGMRVRTQSPKVLDFCRETLRLILQDHPRECLGCPRNGTCELQQLVTALGIDFPYVPPSRQRAPLVPAGSYFERDYSLCVRCGRCVRVCHEVRGARAIVFREKEGRQEVGTPLDRPLAEAGCEFCGACVDVCPVGALRETLDVSQGEGWRQMSEVCENLTNIVMTLFQGQMQPSSKTSVCPICTAGCSLDFETAGEHEVIRVRPSMDEAGLRGQACIQGRFLLKRYLQRTDRILWPVVREGVEYRQESWESALDYAARRFKSYNRDEVAVLTNARLSNEDLYTLRVFARDALKTRFVGSTAIGRHSFSKGMEFEELYSEDGPDDMGALNHTDCALVFGFNPQASHPIAGVQLRRAAINGMRLITAGPCKTAPARYADIHLRHYPGMELFVLAGLARLLMDENQKDSETARRRSPELKLLWEYSPDSVSRITGTPEADLIEAARLIRNARELNILYGTGLFASPKYADVLQAMRALMLIKGIRPENGGAILPAFGGGNSLGELVLGKFFDPLGQKSVFDALASGKVKALYLAVESMEDNPLEFLQQWLERLDFVLIHDVVMPGERIKKALPSSCAFLPLPSILEKGGTFTCGGEKQRRIVSVLPAPDEAKSVAWVVGALARKMDIPGFSNGDTRAVLQEMCRRIPFFAESPPRDAESPSLRIGWNTVPVEVFRDMPDKEFPFALVLKEQLAPYFMGPLLAKETADIFNSAPDVEMSPGDAYSMGLLPGDTVRVITRDGEWEGKLSMNLFLLPKMVVLPASSMLVASGGRDNKYAVYAAKVEKR